MKKKSCQKQELAPAQRLHLPAPAPAPAPQQNARNNQIKLMQRKIK